MRTKKIGSILLAATLSLALVAGPALAKGNVGNGQGKDKAGGKGKAAAVSQVKSKAETGSKADKAVKTKITNMGSGQKEKIQTRLKDQQKQNAGKQFTDASGHWAKEKIKKAQSLGLINGYEDGTFRPDEPVTMTEAMVMAVSLAEALTVEGEAAVEEPVQEGAAEEETVEDGTVEEDTEEGTVEEGTEEDGTGEEETGEDGTVEEDVPEVPGWAREKYNKAMQFGIVNVNRFHSQVQADRAQAAVMLAKALGIEPVDTTGVTFSDAVLISPEDIGYIAALQEAGIVTGTPDGKFNPNSAITRAEIAAMLANIVDTVEDDVTGDETGDDSTVEEETGDDSTTEEQTEDGTTEDGTGTGDDTDTSDATDQTGTAEQTPEDDTAQ